MDQDEKCWECVNAQTKDKFIVAGFSNRTKSQVYIIRDEKTARENYEISKNDKDWRHVVLGKVLEESSK